MEEEDKWNAELQFGLCSLKSLPKATSELSKASQLTTRHSNEVMVLNLHSWLSQGLIIAAAKTRLARSE